MNDFTFSHETGSCQSANVHAHDDDFFTAALSPSLDKSKIRKCSICFQFVVNIVLEKEALGCSTSKVLNRLDSYGYKNTESVV